MKASQTDLKFWILDFGFWIASRVAKRLAFVRRTVGVWWELSPPYGSSLNAQHFGRCGIGPIQNPK
jgi:hypothetical protein